MLNFYCFSFPEHKHVNYQQVFTPKCALQNLSLFKLLKTDVYKISSVVVKSSAQRSWSSPRSIKHFEWFLTGHNAFNSMEWADVETKYELRGNSFKCKKTNVNNFQKKKIDHIWKCHHFFHFYQFIAVNPLFALDIFICSFRKCIQHTMRGQSKFPLSKLWCCYIFIVLKCWW